MTDMLNEVGAYLATELSLTVGTNLWRDLMPEDEPDACMAIFDYPGEPSTPGYGNESVELENPRLAVWSRGVAHDRATPRAQAAAARIALAKIFPGTLSSVVYHWIQPMGSPALLGRDEAQRITYFVNYRVRKEPS